jgi:uncharacterized protein (TIGR03067 family)
MRTPVRLTALALLAALAAGCGKKTPDSGAPTPETPAAKTDKDRLQGVWAVEAFEFADPDRKPRDKDADCRLQFEGDRLVIRIDPWEEFSFTLDESKEPKALLLTQLDRTTGKPYRHVTKRTGQADEVGPELKEEWIYKLDGDKLVVALVRNGRGQRPTALKTQMEPFEVMVIRLTRSAEAPAVIPPPRPRATTK